MSIPLLATKLYIPPPRPQLVVRPRLIARLDEGLHCKLTLISAPAGFGKTTLVSAWIAGFGRPVAWLSLDEGENDPIRFLAYLVAALQTIAPTLGAGVLAMLQSPQPPPTESILTALLNDIATIPGPFVLILDDYHSVDSRIADQALTMLLEYQPPHMHLVIITREDPQLPLPRLRARGQLTELRAADVRFTLAEAAGFLNQIMGLNLSEAEIAALEARTEGWVAGLQLAALSMRGRGDVARFVRDFAGDNRYIVDYLIEEVLQRQPERVRSFLLQTSMLDRLNGSLCDAVTDQNDSVVLLDALERGNLFVVPLDDTRHWFRYHHLFADVLAARMLQEQPAHIPILHQRASVWYAQNGLPADAIRHALAARDFVRAAGLIELAWPAMDGSFQAAAWLHWAKAIPDDLVRTRPVLSVAYAWALLNAGELESAEIRLRDAQQWLSTVDANSERAEVLSGRIAAEVYSARVTPAQTKTRIQSHRRASSASDQSAQSADTVQPSAARSIVIVDEAQFRVLPASIATARAYLAQAYGDLPGSVTYGRQALDLLPAGDHLRRGPAAALLGLAQWANGDLEVAHRTLADAMAGFQQAGNLHFAISVISGLADIRIVQGRLRDTHRTYTQALQLALAQHTEGTRPPLRGTADLYLGLSELLHEQGDREAARLHMQRSEELGEQAALPDWRYRLCRGQARIKQAQGDYAGALDLLDQAQRHYYRTPLPDLRPLWAMKTRVWVAQGSLGEALRSVQEQGLSLDDHLSFLREFAHITLARVLLAEATHAPADQGMQQVMSFLDRLQHAAEAGGRMGSVIEVLVLQVLAHQAQGRPAAALAVLERALMLAEPEGYVRMFVDEGPGMQLLLSAAASQGMMPTYIGMLLAAIARVETEVQPHADNADLPLPAPPASELLSQRELEVLRLVSQGFSNREISQRLVLALDTVKGHNRRIYEKLQVQRRTEAVARARELGLL